MPKPVVTLEPASLLSSPLSSTSIFSQLTACYLISTDRLNYELLGVDSHEATTKAATDRRDGSEPGPGHLPRARGPRPRAHAAATTLPSRRSITAGMEGVAAVRRRGTWPG